MSQRLASQNQTDSVPCSWCRAVNVAAAKHCASCGAPLPKAERQSVSFAHALPVGTRLRGGDYEIQNVIGQGRLGITYRALNHRLNRPVALKEWFPTSCAREGLQVLAGPDLGAAEFAASKTAFLDEARVLARFDHAALVSVFAAWEENSSAYMEMELLHGPTLAQVLERFHHLVANDVLRLFAPVLDALEQLHAQNWLHRDLNPHNIVLCNAQFEATDAANCVRAARAVVIDFGAARQIAPDVAQEFAVLVTPGYSPLEQYAVRARRGAYCDLYALCATLYHTLSGQIPPPAPERANGVTLIPLRELAPAVPEALCRAIASGLEIEIARRPQTVGELCALMPPLPSAAPVVPLQNAPQVLAAPVKPIQPVEKTPQVLAAPLKWPSAADDATVAHQTAAKARAGNGWWWIAGPLGFALLMGVLRPRPQVVQEWSAPATRLIDEPISAEPLHSSNPSPSSFPRAPHFLTPWQSQGKIAQPVFSPTGLLAGIDNQKDKGKSKGTIRIWHAQSGRVLHSLGTLNDKNTAEMAFSTDGGLLAIREVVLDLGDVFSAGRDLRPAIIEQLQRQERAQISVVEVSSGKTLWKRNLSSNQLHWSNDGSDLVLQISPDAITGCEARSGNSFERQAAIPFNTASDDATWFADFADKTMRAASFAKNNGWQWKLKSDDHVSLVSFAPDNSWLMGVGTYGADSISYKEGENLSQNYAATHNGGRAWFFDLKTGKTINVWSGTMANDEGAGFGNFFSPRGRYVGINRFSNVLRVWEVRTHRDFAFRWPSSIAPPQFMRSDGNPQQRDLFSWQNSEFSPDENHIILSGMSRKLWLVDLSARTVRQAQLPSPPQTKPSMRLDSVEASFTADNRHVVWVNIKTGQMGRLALDDFTQKVPVEIIDGATSRPE